MYTRDPQHTWRRILPRADRRLQLQELYEIQDLLSNQSKEAISYVGGFYSLRRGLQPYVYGYPSDTAALIGLSSGQIHLLSPYGPLLIDVLVPRGAHVLVPRSGTHHIGVMPLYEETPLTPAGSSYLRVRARITLNDDESFPVALYEDGQVTQYNNTVDPIGDQLQTLYWEQDGNYVGEGLDVHLDVSQVPYLIVVGPGYCYVRGQYIRLSYPRCIPIPETNGSVLIRNGFPVPIVELVPYLSPVDDCSLVLATYVGGSLYGQPNRAVSAGTLLNALTQERSNERELSQLLMERRATSGFSGNLPGVYADPLLDLSLTDYNSPLFSCAFMPEVAAIRPAYDTQTINPLSVPFTADSMDVAQIATCSSSSQLLISQDDSTGWTTLGSQSSQAVLRLDPPYVPRDPTTLVAPSELPTLSAAILQSLASEGTPPSLSFVVPSFTLTVTCTGLPPNMDNLKLTFDSVAITQWNLLVGSPGSVGNTLKADGSGTLSCSFLVNPSSEVNHVVSVSVGGNSLASAVITSDTSQPVTLGTPSRGLAQTFTVDGPTTLSGVWLSLRYVPPVSSSRIALLSIVGATSGIPTQDSYGSAFLDLSNVSTSANGSKWSISEFDEPVQLPSAGTYALLITPLIDGVQYYLAERGKPSLVSASIAAGFPIGCLLSNGDGSWVPQPSTSLQMRLYEALYSNTTSSVVLTLPSVPYDFVIVDVPYKLPPGTSLSLYYSESAGSPWKLLTSNSFQGGTGSRLRVTTTNTAHMSPLIYYGSISLRLCSNRTSPCTWLSTTQVAPPYNNVELTLDSYQPKGTTVTPYFSSNGGITWEPLTAGTPILIDGNIPMYRTTYTARSLSDTVPSQSQSGASITTLRTKYTARVDMATTSSAVIPFIRRISSITYAE